jgi:hypothetical protein
LHPFLLLTPLLPIFMILLLEMLGYINIIIITTIATTVLVICRPFPRQPLQARLG